MATAEHAAAREALTQAIGHAQRGRTAARILAFPSAVTADALMVSGGCGKFFGTGSSRTSLSLVIRCGVAIDGAEPSELASAITKNAGRHRATSCGNSYLTNTVSSVVSTCIPGRGGAGPPLGRSRQPGPAATRVARGAGGMVMVPPPGVSITVGSPGLLLLRFWASPRGASGAVRSGVVDSAARRAAGWALSPPSDPPQPGASSPATNTPTIWQTRVITAVVGCRVETLKRVPLRAAASRGS
jgi:hypothetical protein